MTLGRRGVTLTAGFAGASMPRVPRAQPTDLTDMATDRDRVLNAVARGDLSQRVALDVDGRPLEGAFLRSGQVVNSMIQILAIFADQVTTVAREVGTEGKLGGQAAV